MLFKQKATTNSLQKNIKVDVEYICICVFSNLYTERIHIKFHSTSLICPPPPATLCNTARLCFSLRNLKKVKHQSKIVLAALGKKTKTNLVDILVDIRPRLIYFLFQFYSMITIWYLIITYF